MDIRIPTELESLIREDVERGSYVSADEFVEQAIHLLHEQEEWMAAHRAEIAAKIEEGWNAAERGELSSAEEVRDRMAQRKREWLDKQQRVA